MGDNTCNKRRGKKDRGFAERTTAEHRKRRIAAESALQARNIAKRPRRLMLRNLGALRRIDARLADPSEKSATAALMASRTKAAAAYERAKAAV